MKHGMHLVCGEALMDVFGDGVTPTGMTLDARVGGSPFNVAIGLARLQQPVAYFGGLSNDFLGARLHAALSAEGVDLRAVHRSAAPTTLSIVGVDEAGVPSYAFYGEGCADRQVPDVARAAVRALPLPITALHVGSFALVVQPVAATLRALVDECRGTAVVAYDPNLRLNVEPRLDVWRESVDWMLARAHLVKISAEDLAQLHPDWSAERFAAYCLSSGVRLVVVTEGGAGARGWTPSAQAQVAAVPLELMDTVGAGDTFQAALLTGLAESGTLTPTAMAALDASALRALLDFANRAAALTCSRRGADLPRRGELSPGRIAEAT